MESFGEPELGKTPATPEKGPNQDKPDISIVDAEILRIEEEEKRRKEEIEKIKRGWLN